MTAIRGRHLGFVLRLLETTHELGVIGGLSRSAKFSVNFDNEF